MENHNEKQNCCNCGRFIAGRGYINELQKQDHSFLYCSLCTDDYQAHKEADEKEPAEAPAGMVKAEVISADPVRYNRRTYKPGMTLYVEKEHFSSKLFSEVQ